MSFTKVAPAGIGTSPGNSILIGDSLLHSTGIDIGSNTGIGVTIRKHGDATFTGIITASAFFGDGSGLEGVSSSGIGTPLSDDDTSDLNKIYYANQELVIDSTVTVNHPDTGIAAYTHYQDLVVKDNADFIVADGDTFIPDVLGINTSSLPNPVSSATGGRIRAGTLTNAGANGAPNFPNGVTGTSATFTTGTITGNLNVGGVLTYEDVTNVDSVGLITARAGINLVGNDLNVGSNIKIGNASGIVTATSFRGGSLEITNGTTTINKHSVGVGTTTTAGRNAGVSTATGTLNFNTTLSALEYYNGNKWVKITDSFFSVSGGTESTFGNYKLFTFTSNGTFTVSGSGNIDILVVAGGGQGGLPAGNSNYGGGGGAGGLVWYTGFKVDEGDHSIVVGNGGAQTSGGSGNRQGNDGADSTAFGLTAKGGGGGGGQGGEDKGRPGGSGGGGGYADNGGATTQSSQSNSLSSGTLVHNLGNVGANGNTSPNGGGGGGGAGGSGFSSGSSVRGGAGFNASSLVGTSVGDSGWFAGGGGGSQQAGYSNFEGNNGGNGGGGDGDTYNSNNQTAGQANTGGGGGAGTSAGGGKGGGSGVVIVRVLSSLL